MTIDKNIIAVIILFMVCILQIIHFIVFREVELLHITSIVLTGLMVYYFGKEIVKNNK